MPSPENHSTPKTVSVKLDADTRSRIETLAQSRQRSAHWLMKKAISQYIDQEEKKEAFKKDTLEAWETFQADGLHVTSSEAEAWLLNLMCLLKEFWKVYRLDNIYLIRF